MRILLLLLLLILPVAADQRVVERLNVRYGNNEEVRSLLATLAPNVEIVVQGDQIILAGPSESVAVAKELLEQLDAPPDEVRYFLRLFTLGAENIKRIGASWISSQFGVSYRPCFGSSDSFLDVLLGRGEATQLASPTLIGSLDQECGLELLEALPHHGSVGLRTRFQAQLVGQSRIDLTMTLAELWPGSNQKLEIRVALSDGDSLLVRGLAPAHAQQSIAGLTELPIWGPLFRKAEGEREVLLVITPGLMR